MSIGNDVIRTMIEFSDTEEEADGVIIEHTDHRTSRDKCDYLLALFQDRKISILGRSNGKYGDKDLTDYQAVLSAVINLKWW